MDKYRHTAVVMIITGLTCKYMNCKEPVKGKFYFESAIGLRIEIDHVLEVVQSMRFESITKEDLITMIEEAPIFDCSKNEKGELISLSTPHSIMEHILEI